MEIKGSLIVDTTLNTDSGAITTDGAGGLTVGNMSGPPGLTINGAGGVIASFGDGAGFAAMAGMSVASLQILGAAGLDGSGLLNADGSGNLTAASFIGPLTGNVTGNADTATTATGVGGITVTGTPTTPFGQVLTATSATAADWQMPTTTATSLTTPSGRVDLSTAGFTSPHTITNGSRVRYVTVWVNGSNTCSITAVCNSVTVAHQGISSDYTGSFSAGVSFIAYPGESYTVTFSNSIAGWIECDL